MKEQSNSESKDFRPAPVAHPHHQFASGARCLAVEPVGPECNVIYKCKNCGRMLRFSDVVNYYGIPACPVCVNTGAPFEIEQQPRNSSPAAGFWDACL